MNRSKRSLLISVIVLATMLSSYTAYSYYSIQQANKQMLVRPEFAMKDLDGQLRNIKDWDGKVILLNFWATWCPPCLREIPSFIELQEQYGEQGFQIIGIAVDDEEIVREFANEMEMNYPIMASEFEAIELSRRYGNHMNGLPYSVIINRNGEIIGKITGELSKTRAEKILNNLGIKS